MAADNDGDWFRELIQGADQVALALGWPEDQTLVFGSEQMRIAMPGTAMRDVDCLRCGAPVQGEPFQLWTMVGPHPCEQGGNHLISVSLLLHVTCIGLNATEIADHMRARTPHCFDQ